MLKPSSMSRMSAWGPLLGCKPVRFTVSFPKKFFRNVHVQFLTFLPELRFRVHLQTDAYLTPDPSKDQIFTKNMIPDSEAKKAAFYSQIVIIYIVIIYIISNSFSIV